MEGAAQRAVVKCDKHGLHYDSATQSGCVICRREERGGAAVPARAAAPAQGVGTPAGAPGTSMPVALGFTLLLIVLASIGLYAAHASVAAMFRGEAASAPAPGDPPTGIDASIEREAQDLQQGAGGAAAYEQEPDGQESH